MKTKAIALDSFAHGARQYVAGDSDEFSPGEAEELRKSGLVKFEEAAPQTGVTDSQPAEDDLEDLVGGKAEPAPANKMEPAPKNKGKK